jgi:hypothetical protein
MDADILNNQVLSFYEGHRNPLLQFLAFLIYASIT